MSWLTGSLLSNGWLTGSVAGVVNNVSINIEQPNIVVDVYGQPVNHLFDYWFITQDPIDINNFNGIALNIVENGDSLNVVDGEASVFVGLATIGETYTLVAFDVDGTNYFRYSGVAVEGS